MTSRDIVFERIGVPHGNIRLIYAKSVTCIMTYNINTDIWDWVDLVI